MDNDEELELIRSEMWIEINKILDLTEKKLRSLKNNGSN